MGMLFQLVVSKLIFSVYQLTQIEFYFGDANLSKDKFLQQKIKEHAERCELVRSDVVCAYGPGYRR